VRDPRVGLAGLAGGIGILSGLALGAIGGHWIPIPVGVAMLSALLLLNMSGGRLRKPLAVAVAVVLGLLSLPLIFTIGSVMLIGALLALTVVFYRRHEEIPAWLIDSRHHRRGRSPAQDPPGGGAIEGLDRRNPLGR